MRGSKPQKLIGAGAPPSGLPERRRRGAGGARTRGRPCAGTALRRARDARRERVPGPGGGRQAGGPGPGRADASDGEHERCVRRDPVPGAKRRPVAAAEVGRDRRRHDRNVVALVLGGNGLRARGQADAAGPASEPGLARRGAAPASGRSRGFRPRGVAPAPLSPGGHQRSWKHCGRAEHEIRAGCADLFSEGRGLSPELPRKSCRLAGALGTVTAR